MMTDLYTYDFSYTGYALRIKEMSRVSEVILSGEDFSVADELGRGKETTGKRSLSEIQKRLNILTTEQKEILINGDLISQKQIAFLAVCKLHFFVRDFIVEVLREKYLVFDYQFTEGDWLSFVRRKQEAHPELAEKSESSIYKIRKVTFQILEEAGLIDTVQDKNIQPQILDRDVINVIRADDPVWFKIFLFSDTDINEMS